MIIKADNIWLGMLMLMGGLGLFIYGMTYMGEGLQLAAGDRMRRLLETFTKNRFRGVAAGTAVTALIQSSAATTVMLVGFVNAGLMTLTQSLGVILGADIGTTVTAQIVAFNVVLYLSFPCIAGGFLLFMLGARRVVKYSGQVILGFGILFLGMELMKGAMETLKDYSSFQDWITSYGSHWLVGLALGVVITSIVQSSSATTSVLVAMGATGVLGDGAAPLEIAIPIILGCNIGTCITAWLASLGASLPAKRVAYAHYLFKIIGVLAFLPFLAWYPGLVRWVTEATGGGADNFGRQIAWAHTLFNVIIVALWLPFLGPFKRLIMALKRGGEDMPERDPLYLDPRIFKSPSVALEMARKEITRMARITLDMLKESVGHMDKIDRAVKRGIMEEEGIVDNLAHSITEYLSKLSQETLTLEQSEQLVGMMHAVNDIERVGDHAENIMYLAENKTEHGQKFTQPSREELDQISGAVFEMYGGMIDAFSAQDAEASRRFKVLERDIDDMASLFRRNHLARLNRGECDSQIGVIFLDTLSNLERVGDLANNLGHITAGELDKI